MDATASRLSELINRAREANRRYDQEARRPLVIEFAGVPKAGKTSTINQVAAFFKRCGFRVQVVIERASVCPIRDKKHVNFNIWTACTTLAQLLDHTQEPPKNDDPQILILDRGIFDSLCWLAAMERLSRIRKQEREKVESFLLIDDWRPRITGVFVMLAAPEDSMKREMGAMPVPRAQGSIMNPAVLQQMRQTTEEVAQNHKKLFRIELVDTSSPAFDNNPQETCLWIADRILNWVEEHLKEEIYYLPKDAVVSCFGDRISLKGEEASPVLENFIQSGRFAPRDEVENSATFVQALPVVVIRNKSGDVLRLRRRERADEYPLHEKLVVWAGGHVRREDSYNGDAIRHAAYRELHEELRLEIDESDLRLLGAIYLNKKGKSSRHVAIVFEWRAKSDDVAVSLSSAEFFERRGTSLSGKFVNLPELVNDVDELVTNVDKITEPWSVEIVKHLLEAASRLGTSLLF